MTDGITVTVNRSTRFIHADVAGKPEITRPYTGQRFVPVHLILHIEQDQWEDWYVVGLAVGGETIRTGVRVDCEGQWNTPPDVAGMGVFPAGADGYGLPDWAVEFARRTCADLNTEEGS